MTQLIEPLASPEEVAAFSDEAWPLSEQDMKLAEACIVAASNLARFHAGQDWFSRTEAPPVINTIVVKAASKGFMNPGGFQMERGDAVTFNRLDDFASGVSFDAQDMMILRSFKREATLYSVATVNPEGPVSRSRGMYRNDPRGYVPVAYGGKPFPFGEG